MKIKQTILFFALLLGAGSFFFAPTVYAEECSITNADGSATKYSTIILPCNPDGKSGVFGILQLAINILTGLIGVAVVGGFVYAGVLYSSAGGNADQIKKAKEIIRNIVIGMIAYSLMYAILNFIIPGGLIG